MEIRKKLIENDKVEAIVILPRELFITTDISVTLWILNNNKKARVVTKNGQEIHYRDREKEVLFIDLRQEGHPFEKKFVELTPEDRAKVVSTYHNWQQVGWEDHYENIPEYCYAAKFCDVENKGFSLVPSKYIEFIDHDLEIDYPKEMVRIQQEMKELMQREKESQKILEEAFKGIGYGIE